MLPPFIDNHAPHESVPKGSRTLPGAGVYCAASYQAAVDNPDGRRAACAAEPWKVAASHWRPVARHKGIHSINCWTRGVSGTPCFQGRYTLTAN